MLTYFFNIILLTLYYKVHITKNPINFKLKSEIEISAVHNSHTLNLTTKNIYILYLKYTTFFFFPPLDWWWNISVVKKKIIFYKNIFNIRRHNGEGLLLCFMLCCLAACFYTIQFNSILFPYIQTQAQEDAKDMKWWDMCRLSSPGMRCSVIYLLLISLMAWFRVQSRASGGKSLRWFWFMI